MTLAATSLKLPKTLKSRITRLAKRAGESPHAFMLRVLEDQVEAAERFRRALHRAYIRHHLEVLGGESNVIHTLSAENTGPLP